MLAQQIVGRPGPLLFAGEPLLCRLAVHGTLARGDAAHGDMEETMAQWIDQPPALADLLGMEEAGRLHWGPDHAAILIERRVVCRQAEIRQGVDRPRFIGAPLTVGRFAFGRHLDSAPCNAGAKTMMTAKRRHLVALMSRSSEG